MSLPGWYPDPAGTPNRFRYWNGQSWSPDTTDNPASTPPPGTTTAPPTPGGSSRRRGGGRRLGPLIVVLVAVLVLLLGTVLVLRGLFGERPIADPGPLPSSSVTGWDDSSPTAEPESPTPQPVPQPSMPRPSAPPTSSTAPTPSEDLPLQPCPQGQPTSRQDHPSDGRIHGGGLSFPKVSGWQESSGTAFSWAYDVGEQTRLAEAPDWYANVAVGALFTGDGFDEPRRSAELVMQCVITSGLYPNFTDRQDVWSKAVAVDGHQGWSIRADIQVDDPELSTRGDTVEVIVVDTGSPESLSMFIGAVDIGDRSLQQTMTSTIAALRVE